MKRIILLTLLLLQLPSTAETAVESLLVRRQGDNVNIRVTVNNPGVTTQTGPVVVTLYARQDDTQEWTKITSWNNIAKIPKGYRVSRDYFDENNMTLKNLAAAGPFEVLAAVNAPGATTTVEKISRFDSETGH